MSAFPQLKTSAVMQYPAKKETEFQNEIVRFLDGREQRYRDCGSQLRRWTVRLDLVDEQELAALEEFFLANQGAFGSFTFFDPWEQAEHPDCSIEQDLLEMEWSGEGRCAATLVVRENRG